MQSFVSVLMRILYNTTIDTPIKSSISFYLNVFDWFIEHDVINLELLVEPIIGIYYAV